MRLSRRSLVLLAIAAAGVGAAIHLGLTPGGLAWSEPGATAAGRFFSAALSPTLVSESGSGRSLGPGLLAAVRTTVVFAAAGLSLALVAGLLLGFLASSSLWTGSGIVGRAVYTVTRVLIAFMRSIHELIWAILFLAAFGVSNANAALAIAIPYGGTLAKVFSEMIDEAPRQSAAALRGLGATPLQVYALGLVPHAWPDMAGYAFYRFECALRSAAILGFFGIETLGYYIKLSFDNLYYREVWTYLYALFALVAVMDWWSGLLRRRGAAA